MGTMWPLCVRAHINTIECSEGSTAGTAPAHRAPVHRAPSEHSARKTLHTAQPDTPRTLFTEARLNA
jgi:hypothetical protein